ncbi:MAG: hypothetical protein AB7T06_28110 [Kofleriaceae bacterium]
MSILCLGACQQSRPEPTELAQGTTILESSDTSLAAAFRKDDVVIYMEALRGGPTAPMFQGDPLSPQFEIDIRFVADNGRIFYTRRGGDGFIDSTWADDLEAQNALPLSRESNRLLFDMANEAADELAEGSTRLLGERAKVLAPELDAIVAIGRQAPGTFDMMVDERIKAGLAMNEIPYGKSNGPEAPDVDVGEGYYAMSLHADDLEGSPWGYHSATRLYRWEGYWATATDFCNHGRCPYENGMPSVGWVQAGDGYKPAFRVNSCNTGYGLYSDDGGHNCHDDSRLQMASVMYGNGRQSDPGYSYWCNGKDDDSDISVNIWGWELDNSGYPQATTNSKKGYTHPHFCRNQNNHGYNSKAGCYCDASCLTYGDCCIDGPY